jgi:hypothetical protein
MTGDPTVTNPVPPGSNSEYSESTDDRVDERDDAEDPRWGPWKKALRDRSKGGAKYERQRNDGQESSDFRDAVFNAIFHIWTVSVQALEIGE